MYAIHQYQGVIFRFDLINGHALKASALGGAMQAKDLGRAFCMGGLAGFPFVGTTG